MRCLNPPLRCLSSTDITRAGASYSVVIFHFSCSNFVDKGSGVAARLTYGDERMRSSSNGAPRSYLTPHLQHHAMASFQSTPEDGICLYIVRLSWDRAKKKRREHNGIYEPGPYFCTPFQSHVLCAVIHKNFHSQPSSHHRTASTLSDRPS